MAETRQGTGLARVSSVLVPVAEAFGRKTATFSTDCRRIARLDKRLSFKIGELSPTIGLPYYQYCHRFLIRNVTLGFGRYRRVIYKI